MNKNFDSVDHAVQFMVDNHGYTEGQAKDLVLKFLLAKKAGLFKPSWTQPVCVDCYTVRHAHHEPLRCVSPEMEHCCMCGQDTKDGIYILQDPETVKFPTKHERTTTD